MKTRYPALVFIALLGSAMGLVSCYRPHFNPLLSESSQFEQGLTKTAQLGPIDVNWYEYQDAWFIPDRSEAPSFGWLARYGSSNLQISYLDDSAFRMSEGYWGMPMGAASFLLPMTSLSASTISAAIPPRGYLFMGGCAPSTHSTPYFGTSAVGMDSTITGSNHQGPISANPPSTSYAFLGGSLGPYMGGTSDSLSLAFFWDNSGTYHFAAGYTLIPNNAALSSYSVSASTDFSIYSGPLLREGAFFAYDGGSLRYYLSGYAQADGALYSCYWPNSAAAPILLPGIDTKITAILSDGRLLARKDSETKIYSGLGVLETTLHTGSFRFCYEIYSAGVYYSVFSRTYFIQQGSDPSDARLYAESFRVPTANLASLGD